MYVYVEESKIPLPGVSSFQFSGSPPSPSPGQAYNKQHDTAARYTTQGAKKKPNPGVSIFSSQR